MNSGYIRRRTSLISDSAFRNVASTTGTSTSAPLAHATGQTWARTGTTAMAGGTRETSTSYSARKVSSAKNRRTSPDGATRHSTADSVIVGSWTTTLIGRLAGLAGRALSVGRVKLVSIGPSLYRSRCLSDVSE
jgi:hypothetical protein